MVAHQSLLSMEFSRQESQSGLLFPTPGDLPDPGIEPVSLASPPLTGEFFMVPPRKPLDVNTYICQSLSHVQLFVTSQTIAHQAPLSMEFSSQEYWNGLLFPTPGDLSNSGVELVSLAPPALAGRFFTTEPPGKPICVHISPFQDSSHIGKGLTLTTTFQPDCLCLDKVTF